MGELKPEKEKPVSELKLPHMQFGRRNKDVIVIASLDDTTMLLNEPSEVDVEVHVHSLSSTNDISVFDIPFDLIVSAPTILNL